MLILSVAVGMKKNRNSAVDIRNSKPVEDFYEFIWPILMTIAGKQNLNRSRKCSRVEYGSFAAGFIH